ncbi:hypothetical protein H1Q63_14055, partial [Desmonostoc muscorum CCALA 125]|nr:hypothetical protein [Desmonostoc muscorum CCALA 125]
VAEQISWITYTTIVVSVIVHGISATPLMGWYERTIAKYAKTTPPDTIDEQNSEFRIQKLGVY